MVVAKRTLRRHTDRVEDFLRKRRRAGLPEVRTIHELDLAVQEELEEL